MTGEWQRQSVAGLLAAAVALGAGELVAGLLSAPSMVVAVADLVVDIAPAAFIRFGIEAFGTADKPALLVCIVVVSLALGAALGPVAARLPVVGAGALALFGLVGIYAEARDPLTAVEPAVGIGAVAALAGYLALRLLLESASPSEASAPPVPGRAAGNRRQFLAFAAGAAGAASVSAVAGRSLGSAVDVEAQRAQIVLPDVEGTPSLEAPRGLPVEGISPLITPNQDFYRIDTAFVVPRVDTSTWSLRVSGMVDAPIELSFDELLAMPAVEETITLACVSNDIGGDLVGNAVWRGVLLADLLRQAGVHADASQVVGRSVEGFTVGFPTEVALDGRPAMVAYAMNGVPLPAEHGFPARLVVPGLYGYVSATKWLSEIELTTLDAFDAYWVPRGWAKEAPIKTQSRIDVPRRNVLDPGPRPIAGVAWGGIRGISRVEVRITPEGGEPGEWREARLGEALSQSSWRQWVLEWHPEPGEYLLEVRATDGEGTPQVELRTWPAPDGATGFHRVRVQVRGA